MSDALIDHLERLRDRQDRAALSNLRRGISGDRAGQSRMHPHVVPFLPKNWQRQDDYYLVASLFACWVQNTAEATGTDPSEVELSQPGPRASNLGALICH